MKKVTIVGAGVAGMSAALRLLERGFHVDLYEQDEFVGGMLRSYEDDVTDTRREHSYHMFPNFYFNFWTIAKEIGIQNNFTPRDSFRFLRKDGLENMPAMFNPAGPQDFLRNMTSRAVPLPDLFLYMYSMVDLLAEPPGNDDILDKYSVNGFLHAKPYMTRTAAELHQTLWETVWAISSYQASAKSYRTFIKYTNRYSVPELWLLAGNKWDYLMKPWLEKLKSFGDKQFKLHTLKRIERVEMTKKGDRISKLHFVTPDKSPSVNDDWKPVKGGNKVVNVLNDSVVMAVTPGAFTKLVRDELFDAAPSLGEVRYLEAEPMGAMQLYLKKKIPGMPANVTDFQNAPYYMTFLDYTQLWPDQENTFLYVTCSDVVSLLSVPPEQRDSKNNLKLNLDHPKTAIDYILQQVVERLPITIDDIDLQKTAFDMNTGEELFANLVGSWDRRPTTTTPIENMFMAGTYVQNIIDVATIEGAVISGLNAAEAIRAQQAPAKPQVTVLEPKAFPREVFQALKIAWAPYAASAKMLSEANKFMGRFGPGWEEAQNRFIEGIAKAAKPFLGRVPNPPEYLGSLNWMVADRDLPDSDPLAVGPIYWNYNRDGTRKA